MESKLLYQIQCSSAEDALFNDVKDMALLDHRVLKSAVPGFFGDTRY